MNQLQAHHYFQISSAAALFTILSKATAWWLTGSMGLLSDAMESFVNLAGALFGLWMVAVAQRPPDADHPLGHGKAEYFSSGFEGVLILGAAVAIFYSSAMRLLQPQPLEKLGLGLAFSVLSTLVNFVVARQLARAAERFNSISLHADSRHLMTDVWTSVGVVAGVLLVGLTDWLWLDPLIAMAVALHIVKEAAVLIRASAQGLMDSALDDEALAGIQTVLEDFRGQGLRWHNLRTRRAGAQNFVYLDLLVPPHWNVVQAHDMADAVERRIAQRLPHTQVMTHVEPDFTGSAAPRRKR
ncbi:MAG: cation transporter [Rhodocyclaceae bacterium]|nr:cation transporter [Rhodocyclaceae bacterium]MBX3668928.1 cation transporter [Rhodocyclaceae bacterium]